MSAGGRCIGARRLFLLRRLRDTNSVIPTDVPGIRSRGEYYFSTRGGIKLERRGLVGNCSRRITLAIRQCRLLFPVARDQPLDSIRVAEMLISDRNAPLVFVHDVLTIRGRGGGTSRSLLSRFFFHSRSSYDQPRIYFSIFLSKRIKN